MYRLGIAAIPAASVAPVSAHALSARSLLGCGGLDDQRAEVDGAALMVPAGLDEGVIDLRGVADVQRDLREGR